MKKIFVFALCILFFAACKKHLDFAGIEDVIHGANTSGYIYTSTNETSGNAIIVLARKKDGSVEETGKSPYLTGDKGDAAEGDFDTQWALRIVGEYLLAVNAGANPVNGSISVFKINKANGQLTQVDQDPGTSKMDNMDSRGVCKYHTN